MGRRGGMSLDVGWRDIIVRREVEEEEEEEEEEGGYDNSIFIIEIFGPATYVLSGKFYAAVDLEEVVLTSHLGSSKGGFEPPNYSISEDREGRMK